MKDSYQGITPGRALRLGALNFGNIVPGQSQWTKIRDCVELAPQLDRLGYTRYWLGEHHSHASSFASPEILLPLLAATTDRIRVGAGAILMFYWSPLKAAETFLLLESLFPGRIDLGVGRGRADSGGSHDALLDGRPIDIPGMLGGDVYEQKLDLLMKHLRGYLPVEASYARAPANPRLETPPAVWVCGSSMAGTHAARLGASYCLTLFHRGGGSERRPVPNPVEIERYRQRFSPSRELASPDVSIAVAGVCADTEAEARRLQRDWQQDAFEPTVVGTPDQCREQLTTLASTYGVNEIIFMDVCSRFEDQLHSYELLSRTLGLSE